MVASAHSILQIALVCQPDILHIVVHGILLHRYGRVTESNDSVVTKKRAALTTRPLLRFAFPGLDDRRASVVSQCVLGLDRFVPT